MKDIAPPRDVLDPIEIASRDEISALQLERMKWSLRHAYQHSPFYRASFDAAGVHPHDLRGLSDLAAFPFTTKEDLRQRYPFGMFAVPREQVVRIHASSGQVGIFGAEPWTEAMRAEIEHAFDMHAVDIYGLSEVIGPGVANECVESKDGLHIWEDHFYPEIIDPDTGELLPDGERGELVFTSLTKEATPIIRYRTPHLTRLLPATPPPIRR